MWVASVHKGEGLKDPSVRKGGDPRTLASRRHWQVVTVTAGVLWTASERRSTCTSSTSLPSSSTIFGVIVEGPFKGSVLALASQCCTSQSGYMLREMCRGSSLHESCVLASSLLIKSSLASPFVSGFTFPRQFIALFDEISHIFKVKWTLQGRFLTSPRHCADTARLCFHSPSSWLVLACCFPIVTSSPPCRRTLEVSRRHLLRLTSTSSL